ncbi:MAG: hypothetical protein AB7E81_24810 [Hyphomicrobiaceae bacterium]
MSPERFQQLAETYGGNLQRWPADARQAAHSFLRTHPADARAVLADAAPLDRRLDSYVVAEPGRELRERIISLAPVARAAWRGTWMWWQGLGLAGIGIAGALAGALMISALLPLSALVPDDDGRYVITAFDDVTHDLDK